MVPSSHVFLLFGMFFRVGCSPKKAKLLLPRLRSWQTAETVFLVYLFWHLDLLPHYIFGKPSVFLFTLGRVGYGGLHTPPLPPKLLWACHACWSVQHFYCACEKVHGVNFENETTEIVAKIYLKISTWNWFRQDKVEAGDSSSIFKAEEFVIVEIYGENGRIFEGCSDVILSCLEWNKQALF